MELALASAFWGASITLVFREIGTQAVAETDTPSSPRVEGSIAIEIGVAQGKPQAAQVEDGRFQMLRELIRVVMIARHNARRGDDVAMGVADGQDIGGLGAFAPLVSDRFAAFLGQRMTSVEIEVCGVHLLADRHDATLPHTLEAAVPAPLAEVMVDRAPADFFLGALSALDMTGSCAHWQPVCSWYRM